MKNSQRGSALLFSGIVVLLAIAGVGGWIANIVKLVGMSMDPITGMLIVRAVGIVLAPLGAVMGYL